MRVNGNPLLLELHHFVRALPPFLAAAHTAASHGVRSSWGAVQLVSPLRAWCPLGASCWGLLGPQGHCCPPCLVCMCWGVLVQLLLVAQQLCAAELERGWSFCFQPSIRLTCFNHTSQIRAALLQSLG